MLAGSKNYRFFITFYMTHCTLFVFNPITTVTFFVNYPLVIMCDSSFPLTNITFRIAGIIINMIICSRNYCIFVAFCTTNSTFFVLQTFLITILTLINYPFVCMVNVGCSNPITVVTINITNTRI